MGIGAHHIGMAGAVVAKTNDIYSTYWNPAGLVEIKDRDFTIARQLNAELINNNMIAIGSRSSLLSSFDLDSAMAFSYIPRLHIKAKGAFRKGDLESIFLRYALPGLPENFDGQLESKTKDYRFSLAVAPLGKRHWSIGFSLSRIECATTSCGVTAEDPGNYIITSTDATAIAMHFGAKYFFSDNLTIGLNIEDIDTTLVVEVETTDNQGTRKERYKVSFPHDLTLGFAWNYSDKTTLSMDYEMIYGHYGDYKIDFQILRSGAEFRSQQWRYRMGALVPIKLNSDKIDNIDLPAPFVPTMGMGWQGGSLDLDLAVYAHPIMSYQRKKLYPSADLSIIYHF